MTNATTMFRSEQSVENSLRFIFKFCQQFLFVVVVLYCLSVNSYFKSEIMQLNRQNPIQKRPLLVLRSVKSGSQVSQ